MAKEERCEDCEVAVLGGMVLNVCEFAKPAGVDCRKMKSDFLAGKTTINDMLDELMPKLKNDRENYEVLEEIKRISLEP